MSTYLFEPAVVLPIHTHNMPILEKQLLTLLRRNFATATASASASTTAVSRPTLRCTNEISWTYKNFVVQESQKAVTEYLHGTQGLPFFFADQIAKNSLFCLSDLLHNFRFSAPEFPTTIRKYLRYQSINEFEFFLESIGIDHREIPRYLPRNRFFLSDNGGAVLEAAGELFQFGFPWSTLGKLYVNDVSIFSRPVGELTARLGEIGSYCGFSNLQTVGACLAFTELLVGEDKLGPDSEALFQDLKRVFEEFGDGGFAQGNLDYWYELCCKIRFLYELGCERGTVWERRVLLNCPKRVLEDKVNYFCKFGVGKDKVGLLLLQNPEFFCLDLRTPVISVSGLLEHFGMDAKELRALSTKYPHVFGRNKMGSLPGIARALDLHEWFFGKIENSGCELFVSYAIHHSDKEVDKEFQDAVKKIESKRCHARTMSQLDFLTGLGFGENALTLNVLSGLQSASCCGLQQRFNYLLGLGIKHSEICLLMKMAPRTLCLNPKLLGKKLDYLCREMGSSIKHLVCFPRILVYDLENRIKPRHRFFVWLRQTGLYTKSYTAHSIIDLSEKRFMARISYIHRAAPKLYLECYLIKS